MTPGGSCKEEERGGGVTKKTSVGTLGRLTLLACVVRVGNGLVPY
jgi:hypothetical protein